MLKKLDPIHHQGLRIVLGAFCTSPVTSLFAKAQEMSFSKPLCESTRDVFQKQMQETVSELCFETKNLS